MTLMDDVAALQKRLADAQRERARAEGAYATAQAIAEQARAELKRDFEVDTIEDAEALMATYRQELALLVQQITTELDRIGVA
jgi:uncharacterized protein involved in exopolysaccharide biosynthesis